MTLAPNTRLARGATYTATARAAEDEAGNALVQLKTWRSTVTKR